MSLIYTGIRFFLVILRSIVSDTPETNKYVYLEAIKVLMVSFTFVLLGICIGWLGYEYILQPWITYLAYLDASGK